MKGRPSFHCTSILGKLYDDAVFRARADISAPPAVAGRRVDKYGSVTSDCLTKDNTVIPVFDSRIRATIGIDLESTPMGYAEKIFRFASKQRDSYEQEFLAVMDKYALRSEGEVATGCIRKYNKLHKRRKHEFAEEVGRAIKEIRSKYREIFLNRVQTIVHLEAVESESTGDSSDDPESDSEQSYDELMFSEYFEESEDENSADGAELSEDDLESRMKWTERVVTSRQNDLTTTSDKEVHLVEKTRLVAGHLASAYYEVTYHSEYRWKTSASVLFSFPWLVCGDILSSTMKMAQDELE